jgi:Uma2 family endonuclease
MLRIPLLRREPRPGRPLPETDLHRNERSYLVEALQDRFREAPDVTIAGGLPLCYHDRKPRLAVVPDVLVARGLARAKEPRQAYRIWEEFRPPVCVIEVASAATVLEDAEKKDLYERLGIAECFLHDPAGESLFPGLQGFRLVAGAYQPIEPEADGSLISRTLHLVLRPETGWLRLADPVTGEPLSWGLEQNEARRAAERQAAQARQEASKVRQDLARLRDALADFRIGVSRHRH